MKCKNKIISVEGIRSEAGEFRATRENFTCAVTNDKRGKTLSISDGKIQFTIPFEPLQKYLL